MCVSDCLCVCCRWEGSSFWGMCPPSMGSGAGPGGEPAGGSIWCGGAAQRWQEDLVVPTETPRPFAPSGRGRAAWQAVCVGGDDSSTWPLHQMGVQRGGEREGERLEEGDRQSVV